jgi:hypothetical protein
MFGVQNDRPCALSEPVDNTGQIAKFGLPGISAGKNRPEKSPGEINRRKAQPDLV